MTTKTEMTEKEFDFYYELDPQRNIRESKLNKRMIIHSILFYIWAFWIFKDYPTGTTTSGIPYFALMAWGFNLFQFLTMTVYGNWKAYDIKGETERGLN